MIREPFAPSDHRRSVLTVTLTITRYLDMIKMLQDWVRRLIPGWSSAGPRDLPGSRRGGTRRTCMTDPRSTATIDRPAVNAPLAFGESLFFLVHRAATQSAPTASPRRPLARTRPCADTGLSRSASRRSRANTSRCRPRSATRGSGRCAASSATASSILGHHYQRDEVIQFADFRGDSFKLSQQAAARTGGRVHRLLRRPLHGRERRHPLRRRTSR